MEMRIRYEDEEFKKTGKLSLESQIYTTSAIQRYS